MRISWGALVLCGLTFIALGAAAAWMIGEPAPPSELAEPPRSRTIAIIEEPFDDARSVELVLELSPEAIVAVPRDGTLTASSCVAGAILTSGSSPFALDGSPVLALYSRTPFFRDFAIGMRGSDVSDLQAELQRLGHAVDTSGTFDSQTLRALGDAASAVGVDLPDTGVVSSLVWLAKPDLAVAACNAQVGSRVAVGQSLATAEPVIASARLVTTPEALVPGARVLALGERRLGLDEQGRLDPSALAELSATPEYAAWRQSEGAIPLAGELRLADPIDVHIVPPSAVAGDRVSTCVVAGDETYPVDVVSSRLGSSYVTSAVHLPEVIDVVPARQQC